MTRKGSQIPQAVAQIAAQLAKPKVALVADDVQVVETPVLAKCTVQFVQHVERPVKFLSSRVARSQFTVQIVSRDSATIAHVVTHAGNCFSF
jgi:hypothetical protein